MGILSRLFKLGQSTQCQASSAHKTITKDQIEQFIQSTFRGSVCCRVGIIDVGELVSALQLQFMRQGIPTGKVLELLNQKLVGVCPDCHTNSTGKGLIALHTYREMKNRGTKVVFNGDSGGAERLLEGQCRNQKCSCKVILLNWLTDISNDSVKEVFLDFTQIGESVPKETSEQLKKRVELHIAKMDQERNPEEIFKDFQRVQCAICGRVCWRSYGGQVVGGEGFLASYQWHKAGYCKACSIVVCGVCSFLTAREREIKADTCPKCESEIT